MKPLSREFLLKRGHCCNNGCLNCPYMENKYFTPDIEDIRVGYECEISTPANPNFDSYVWDYVTLSKHNFNYETPLFALSAKLRVPYLTKEQIEAEGWRHIGKTQDIWFEKEGDFDMGSWTSYKVKLQYELDDKRLRIFAIDIVDKQEYDMFRGECKDINTFKYICKLLKIN